jgi:lipopolysaccharide/colanic/teichoic acid biosynthesis glycosyltransferase
MPTKVHARVKLTPKSQASGAPGEQPIIGAHLTRDSRLSQRGSDALGATGNVTELPLPDAKPPSVVKIGQSSRVNRRTYLVAKRIFDLVVSVPLLLIATPIVLAAALAIRVNTPGSPFFFQTRLGMNGKPFKIFKLRGMYIDARSRFPAYYDYSQKRDLEFCFHHEHDPRVTSAGRIIRKTSIDELPNLWNVVTGDMSLVGPRPEIPEVLSLYGPHRDEYVSVKPGITCLSKITGRDRLTKRETINFDLRYIRTQRFGLDIKILWKTFSSVVLRRDVF